MVFGRFGQQDTTFLTVMQAIKALIITSDPIMKSLGVLIFEPD
jgi:hypothetical protein